MAYVPPQPSPAVAAAAAKIVKKKQPVTPPKGPTGPVSPAKTPGKGPGKTSGKTAYQIWLAGKMGAGKGPKGPNWSPLDGMPTDTTLTPYPTLDASTLPDGSDVPYVPGHAFKQGKAGLLDPQAYAKLVGAASYNPITEALTGQQDRLKAGVGQANQMIDQGFGQAADSSLRGADIVKNSNATANQGLTDLAARMAQAAGGDPTAAAAVGQATANQIGNDTRFANIDADAQAAEAAAANRDAATAKVAYKGASDSAIGDLAQKIAEARTQGKQAQGAAIKDALGFNSDQQTAQTSRDVSKQEAWLAGQLAGPQIEASRLANEGTRAGLKLNVHNAQVNDWSTLNTSQQNQNVQKWTSYSNKVAAHQIQDALDKGTKNPVYNALADPTGAGAAVEQDVVGPMLTSGGPLDPGTIYTKSIQVMHQQYPDVPAGPIKALAVQFALKQMGMWNSQHAKGQKASGKTWKLVNGAPALVKK